MMAALQIGKGAVALPDVRTAFGVDLASASWLISMFNVIGVFGGALIGQVADRFGYRRTMLVGLTLVSVASLTGAVAPSFALLLVTRLAEGLGFMLAVIAGPPLIVRVTTEADRRLAFGFWGSYMPAGAALIMLSAPALQQYSWRALWIVSGIAVGVSALTLALTTREYADRRNDVDALPSPLRSILGIYRSRGPLVLALTFGAYTAAYLAVMGLLPTVLREVDGVASGKAAILAGIAIAMNAVGTIIGGWLLHRAVPRPVVIATASVAMALCAFAAFELGPFLLRYLAVLLFSLIGGLIPTAIFAAAPVLAPSHDRLGVTNGVIMQGSNLGQVIGPPVVSYLAQMSGSWKWTPLVVCISSAILLACAFSLSRIEPRAPTK